MIELAKEIAKESGLVTKPELADIENEIPDARGLVKKKRL